MTTTFFSFNNRDNADKFIGALLDHGASSSDISVIARESGTIQSGTDIQKHAETGITTTTAADFAKGAAAGTGIGLGVGVAAGLAALLVPGFGLVLGGGALATAIAGAAATTAGLALAGGLAGFMRDMGVEGEVPDEFERDYAADHVIVAVNSHADGILLNDLEGLAEKYHATRTTLRRPTVAAVPVDTETIKKPIVDPVTGEREVTTVEVREPIGASQVETVPVPPVVPIPGTQAVQPVAASDPTRVPPVTSVESRLSEAETIEDRRLLGTKSETVEVRPAFPTTRDTVEQRTVVSDGEGNMVAESVLATPAEAPRGDVFLEKTTVQQPNVLRHTEIKRIGVDGQEVLESSTIDVPAEDRVISKVTVNPVTGVTEREIVEEPVPLAESLDDIAPDPAQRFYKA